MGRDTTASSRLFKLFSDKLRLTMRRFTVKLLSLPKRER